MIVRPRRRGMAPLEFVFVFPLLLCLTAALFLVARADLSKSFSATDARHRAWAGRAAVPAGEPLTFRADPANSLAARTTLKDVPAGPLFAAGFKAESRNTVFAHPWDKRAVPFTPGHPRFEPHLDELGMVTKQIPVVGTGYGYLMQGSAWLIDPERDPALLLVAGVGSVLNYVVIVAGWILEYITAPALGAVTFGLEVIIDILTVPAWFSRSVRRFRNYLKSVVDMINVGTWACHNLYAASQGRPGNWNGNIFVKLLNFQPR